MWMKERLRDFTEDFRRNIFFYAMITPAIAVIIILYLYPVLKTIQVSLYDFNLLSGRSEYIAFANYINKFTSPKFQTVLFNSFYFTVVSVAIETVLGLSCALLLNYELRGQRLMRIVIMIPMMVAPVIVAYEWKLMYNDQVGIITYIFESTGIIKEKISWLSHPRLAMWSCIIADVWYTTPFVILILLGGLQSLPRDPYEAAVIDGANALQRFTLITLPLLKPVLMAAILLKTMDAFKMFDLIYILTYGGPSLKTEVINIHTYKTVFRHFRFGEGATISIITLFSLIFIVIVIMFIFKGKDIIQKIKGSLHL